MGVRAPYRINFGRSVRSGPTTGPARGLALLIHDSWKNSPIDDERAGREIRPPFDSSRVHATLRGVSPGREPHEREDAGAQEGLRGGWLRRSEDGSLER